MLDSSRSRRQSYSRATAAPSHTRSSRTRTSSTPTLPAHRDELYLKRLIVGGLERVYEIGKDFRNEGVSYKNQPEFTMLEWYEAYADYEDTMARIEELVERVASEVLGTTVVQFKGHEVDLKAPWARVPFVEALERLELWTRDADELRAWLEERGVDTTADKDWAQLVDHAFSHFVEPSLVVPTIVHGYPVELSPFARTTDDDPTLTERFEYFVAGMGWATPTRRSPIRTSSNCASTSSRSTSRVSAATRTTSRHSRTACRRQAASAWGSTGCRCCSPSRETIRDVILFPALRSGED